MRYIFLVITLCFNLGWATNLKVGVLVDQDPFSFYDERTQTFQGITVDLWNQAVTPLGITSEFYKISDHYYGIELVRLGVLDAMLGPYNLSHETHGVVVNSPPYYVSNVTIFSIDKELSFSRLGAQVFQPLLIKTFGVVFGSFIFFSFLYYLFERKKSLKGKPVKKKMGIIAWSLFSSFLRDLVVIPATSAGKLIISLWLMLSVIFMSIIAAIITSSIINIQMANEEYKDLDDISGKTVGILEYNGVLNEITHEFNAFPFHYENYEKMTMALNEGEIDLVLVDKEAMKHFLYKKNIKNIKYSNLTYKKFLRIILFKRSSPWILQVSNNIVKILQNNQLVPICRDYNIAFPSVNCKIQ